MVSKKVCSRVILIFLIAILGFLSCENLQEEPPTGIEAKIQIQPLKKSSLSSLISSTPDIIVDTTFDVADFVGAQQVGDLPGSDGVVSLREAIIAANNTLGSQVIGFNIPTGDPGFDGSVFTIRPYPDPLPILTDAGTAINGSSQTSFTQNTNPAGPEIFLDGGLIDPNAYSQGIGIASAANHVHELGIGGFIIGIGIGGDQAKDNLITGCFIGLDPAGAAARPNRIWGISAANFASGIRIGGPTSEERNVISGNGGYGIYLANYLQHCTIQNNYLGTDATGLVALHNSSGIIVTDHCQDVVIKNNLISGNLQKGVGLRLVHDIRIEGNIIGPDSHHNTLAGNDQQGIAADGGPSVEVISNLVIGGDAPNLVNLIAGNPQGGIVISATMQDVVVSGNRIIGNGVSGIHIYGSQGANLLVVKSNSIYSNYGAGISPYHDGAGISVLGPGTGYTISQNRIFGNDLIGIDLAPDWCCNDGVTPNDLGDIDIGPNNLMNYPVLESAKATPGKLIVKGYIDTTNPKRVTIEFFANPIPSPGGDPSGFGEGAIFLGTDRPNPQGKFTTTLPAVKPGTLISATATDVDGNTSEFAADIEAKRPGH